MAAGLELLEEVPDLDAIVVPIGGGGFISGVAIAAHGIDPKIKVIGVEPEDGNDTYLSVQAGKHVEIPPPASIADGLRAPSPGKLTLPVIQKHVDRIVLVSDDEIRSAMRFLMSTMKLVVEPSGAVTVGAALTGKLAGVRKVGLMLSGGNVDLAELPIS